MIAHFMRHGDFLTVTELVDDPVYLTEPYVVSRVWQLDPHANIGAVPAPCTPETEVARLDGQSSIPHFLPGQNPYMKEVTGLYNIPEEAVMGGAETMYPEYRKRLKDKYTPPEKCIRYCCGWGGGNPNPATALGCITDGSGRVRKPDENP
jgi:hypothetical protein